MSGLPTATPPTANVELNRWREAEAQVCQAWDAWRDCARWLSTPPHELREARSLYCAALDQESKAAADLKRAVERSRARRRFFTP